MKKILFILITTAVLAGAACGVAHLAHQRNHEILQNEHRASDFVSDGMKLCDTGDYDSALRLFERASAFAPHFPYLEDAFGRAYLGKGDYDKAMNAYTNALKEYALDAFAYAGTARILATTPDSKIYSGPKAVWYAERARDLAYGNLPDIEDTLAIAYGSNAEWRAAAQAERHYLSLPNLSPSQRPAAEARLSHYAAHVIASEN